MIEWRVHRITRQKRQVGGIDCGIFACKFLEYLVTSNTFVTLVKDNILRFRMQYAVELFFNEDMF